MRQCQFKQFEDLNVSVIVCASVQSAKVAESAIDLDCSVASEIWEYSRPLDPKQLSEYGVASLGLPARLNDPNRDLDDWLVSSAVA